MIQALIKYWPLISRILRLLMQDPSFAVRANDAIKHAEDTQGDTSKIEDLIRRGR